jgi:hypothetical protein
VNDGVVNFFRLTCLANPPKNITLAIKSRTQLNEIKWTGLYLENESEAEIACPDVGSFL